VALIVAVLLATFGIGAAVMSRLLADEFKAWSPWIVERLIRRAIAKLPDECKERYDEEWRGHLNAIPGELGRLVTAFGLVIAADRICYGPWTKDLRLKTAFDKIAAVWSICFWLPLLLLLALVIKLESKGPVLVKQRCYGLRNRSILFLGFGQCTLSGMPKSKGITSSHQ
jgi:hypothetical protein